MTTDLKKLAEKNQTYYLQEQVADDRTDKWFRYVKTMDSYAEPVLVTPAMAKEVLAHYREEFDLRKPKKMKVSDESHPTITFSFAGKLLDGQTILEAIAIGVPLIAFVSFNVSDRLSFMFE